MNSQISSSTCDPAVIRAQFDEILKEHITRLIEVDSASEFVFDLLNVSSVIMLVEREKEIQKEPDSPPARYNKENLSRDLMDLGVLTGESSETVFSNLVQHDYAGIDDNGNYIAQIPAFALVNFLDSLFPEMQGMNLVAYVLQFIDEVLSGRKDIEKAKANFDQTLFLRGVALSEQKPVKIERNGHGAEAHFSNIYAPPVFLKKNSEAAKQEYAQKLSRLRSKKADDQFAKPAVFTQNVFAGRKIEIKEVFPKTDSDVEPVQAWNETGGYSEDDDRTGAVQASDAAPLSDNAFTAPSGLTPADSDHRFDSRDPEPDSCAASAGGADDKDDEIGSQAESPAANSVDDGLADEQSEPISASASDLNAAHDADAQSEPADAAAKLSDAAALQPEPETISTHFAEPDVAVRKTVVPDDLIEKQIAAFQEELAIACPLCRTGKILSAETEKGKVYYSCDNPTCRFVSWSKPWHYECPLCKSPFLAECPTPEGNIGLKCPRSTCVYFQDNLNNPVENRDLTAAPKKRKRKVVRRVRRKR